MKKEEKTEITRNRIFQAAMREFAANGFAAGSVNNICKTGINKGLIYHNFKDKEELYLECVRRSCDELIAYVLSEKADEGFVEYMSARRKFFQEYESEACIFLEARTHPPDQLQKKIGQIFSEFEKLNIKIFKKELSRFELREGVTEEEALNYFLEIQKIYNLSFMHELKGKMSFQEQLALHEMNIHRIFDLMLYGIAKGGNEEC
ncbi:MAG: TetR/AcrR family transcriptional regulator [Suilimivivens sp.]